MRLSRFITSHRAEILVAWDEVASTMTPAADRMSGLALRNHAGPMLQTIAQTLAEDELAGETSAEAGIPRNDTEATVTAASTHGSLRQLSGFSLEQLTAEISELRATVLRLWLDDCARSVSPAPQDIVSFNRAVDRLLAESVEAFTERVYRSRTQLLEASHQAAILNALPAQIALLDEQGTIASVNDAWRRFAGENALLSGAFGVGLNYLEVCDQAHGSQSAEAKRVAVGIRAVLAKQVASYAIEYACHSPTQRRWFLLRVTPLADEHDAGAVVMHVDISERKEMEATLRESEQRFASAFEQAPIGVALVAPDGHWLKVNRALCGLLGYSEAELLTRTFQELTHPEDLALDVEYVRRMIAGELSSYRMEKRYRHALGHFVPAELSVSLIRDESHAPRYFISQIQDISALKEAVHQARQLAQRLSTTLYSITDAFFTVDREWRFTFLNHEAERLLRRTRLELIDHNLWREFPETLGSRFESEYRRAMTERVTVEFEEIFEPLDSHFEVRAFPSEQGLAVYFRDVSDSKRAQAALRASEQEFRNLAEAMPQIVWVTGADGGILYLNGQWQRYTGLSLAASLGSGWAMPFHPDERGTVQEAWQSAMTTTGTYSIESRLRRNDGEYRWFLVRATPVLDAAGSVIKWFGTCTDVHGMKLAELEISRSNQELRESESRVRSLNRVYAVLSQVNAMIVRVRDRDQMFHEVCRIAVEVGDFRLACIGVVDRDAMAILPRASAGAPSVLCQVGGHRVEIADSSHSARGPTAIAIQTGQVFVSNDVANDARIENRQAHTDQGIRALASLPLVLRGEAVAVFTLHAAEPGFFDEAEVKLLDELAVDIALAIEHIDRKEQLDYLAYYDTLTGLANRTLFLERVGQHIARAAGGAGNLALFLLDIERFQNINDSLGRAAGDALLVLVAKWLALRAGDASCLARVGPDQFAVLMPDLATDVDLTGIVEAAMEALSDHPFTLDDAVLRLAVKVGVSAYPEHGENADILFKHAESALKKAKAQGERYLVYSEAMTTVVVGQQTMENQMRRALQNEEFILHYQPKVKLASGAVVGAEALIRWNNPKTGLVPPAQFIPVLEETGLIHQVGRWAVGQAMRDYLRWREAGLPSVRIAVNVSALQLRSRAFVAEIGALVAADARVADGLELEITESIIMGDIKHGTASLQAIRAFGVTIALDDFGTGFSSLGYLSRLPIDTLKIDRSFITEMTANPAGLALVSTIISLAHSLAYKVVAEGVETSEQSRLLSLLRCDEMQGYFFGRPVDCAAFEATYLVPIPVVE